MIFIVHPNVPEEETPAVTDKVTSIINQHKGEVISLKKWGKKKLAHKIKNVQGDTFFFYIFWLPLPYWLSWREHCVTMKIS